MKTLTENLSRATSAANAATVDDEGGARTLHGHFSVFDTWYEVNSVREGHFMERIRPGAFARTLAERGAQIKALYDHGHDPQLGNKPLGPFKALREDETGGYYEIELIDTDYNRDFIIPATRAGLLGSSFRFSIVPETGETWNMRSTPSEHNPKGLPERSIVDANVYELGPVTFPANAAAGAALRSTSDEFYDRLLNDPLFVARFTERVGVGVVEKVFASLPPDGRSPQHPERSADGQLSGARSVRLDGLLTDIHRLRKAKP